MNHKRYKITYDKNVKKEINKDYNYSDMTPIILNEITLSDSQIGGNTVTTSEPDTYTYTSTDVNSTDSNKHNDSLNSESTNSESTNSESTNSESTDSNNSESTNSESADSESTDSNNSESADSN
tara:strand:+ start:422 stop:793 length:372 start_codon:yes stop_codon:yes gene_type:complete